MSVHPTERRKRVHPSVLRWPQLRLESRLATTLVVLSYSSYLAKLSYTTSSEVCATEIWATTFIKINWFMQCCGALGMEERERIRDYRDFLVCPHCYFFFVYCFWWTRGHFYVFILLCCPSEDSLQWSALKRKFLIFFPSIDFIWDPVS